MSKTTVLLKIIRGLGWVLPSASARIARHLFRSPNIAPTKPWEVAVESQAERGYLSNGISYLKWGVAEPRVRIIAMHGWEGRSTQWGPLADVLRSEHCEVIALDGPGHGKSVGRHADPILFAEALLHAEKELGPFDAALGHSMGAGSCVVALYRGLAVKKLVYIAGPAAFREVVERFATAFGLPPRARQAFIRQIEGVNGSFDDADVIRVVASQAVSGLIVHDRGDDDVPYEDAVRLNNAWPNSRLLTTAGLGHKRVLRDPAVMKEIADFLADQS